MTPDPGESSGSADEFQIVQIMCFYSKSCSDLTPVQCFLLTSSYPSHLKHLFVRAFLEDCLPEMLSKLGVLAERGIKKSKKHCTGVRSEPLLL